MATPQLIHYVLLITVEPVDPQHPVYYSFNGAKYEKCPINAFQLSSDDPNMNQLILVSDFFDEIEVPIFQKYWCIENEHQKITVRSRSTQEQGEIQGLIQELEKSYSTWVLIAQENSFIKNNFSDSSTAIPGSRSHRRDNTRMKLTSMVQKYEGENRAVCGENACNPQCVLM